MTGEIFTGPPANDGGVSGSSGFREIEGRSGTTWPGLFQRASAPALLCSGERLCGTPYRIVRHIGQGGMGEVHEVEHVTKGFHGALKVLHPNHRGRADLAERLRQEARMLVAVDHRAVVRLLDHGETVDRRPYLVMELLHGRDLREVLIRSGPLPVTEALLLIAEALDGLAAVHAAGIVHRDVKLENLFLCRDSSLKVVDFGVAKAGWAAASPTIPGVSLGTPRTMAPEQCALRGVDPRADIYAAGLSLYELCVGRGPFDEIQEPHALRFAHCTRRPPRPAEIAPQPIPPDVEGAILRALAKAPEERFQSAREMAMTLRLLATGGSPPIARSATQAMTLAPTSVPAPRSASPRPDHGAARREGDGNAAFLVVLSLLLFGTGLIFGRSLAAPSAREAPAVQRLR
jgi:eukaryotic-like serine/threonine-protein kinase